MVWLIQDFVTTAGAMNVVAEMPMPDGTDPNVVRMRMAGYFDAKAPVEGVRILNEKGEEIGRWTWDDEEQSRQARAAKQQRIKRRADVKGHRLEEVGDRFRLISKDYNIVELDDATLDEIEEFLKKPDAP
jgi:hypothetical protein